MLDSADAVWHIDSHHQRTTKRVDMHEPNPYEIAHAINGLVAEAVHNGIYITVTSIPNNEEEYKEIMQSFAKVQDVLGPPLYDRSSTHRADSYPVHVNVHSKFAPRAEETTNV